MHLLVALSLALAAQAPADDVDDVDDDGGEVMDLLSAAAVPAGGAAGCVVGGVVPAAGVGLGAGIIASGLYEASQRQGWDACGLAFVSLVVGGMLLIPSGLALGPCASVASCAGVGIGGLLGGRTWWAVLLGAIPGVVVGMAASAAFAFGLSFAGDSRDPTAGWLMAGGGLLAAAVAGPLVVAGAVTADWLASSEADDDEDDGEDDDVDDDAAPPPALPSARLGQLAF